MSKVVNQQSVSGLGQLSALPSSATAPASRQPVTRQSAPARPSDHVQLSNMSQYLADAMDGSPAHLQMLSNLQNAVGTGQYQVDANTVSGSIIQHSIRLSGEGHPNGGY